ncbi:MAG: LysM domain-containing protein [Phycisphaeraceae bacterium]
MTRSATIHREIAGPATLTLFGLSLALSAAGCRVQPKEMPQVAPPPPATSVSTMSQVGVEDSASDAAVMVEPDFVEPGPPPPPRAGVTSGEVPVSAQLVPVVVVPAPAPGPAAVPVLPTLRSYEIKKGDSLWKIAERELGSGLRWQEIADANPGIDPAKLAIGQVLILPE